MPRAPKPPTRNPRGSETPRLDKSRSPHRWRIRVKLPDGTHATLDAPTKQGCYDRKRQALADFGRGGPDELADGPSVEQRLRYWHEEIVPDKHVGTGDDAHELAANTRYQYDRSVAFISAGLGKYGLRQLTADHVRKFMTSLPKKGQGRASCTKIRGHLVAFLDWCVDEGDVPRNVATRATVDRRATAPVRRRAFTGPELDAMFDVHDKCQDGRVFGFLIETGARKGEVLDVRWRNVDLAKHTCSFVTGVAWRGKGHGRRSGLMKTPHSVRTIKLSDTAVEILRARKREQAHEERTPKRWRWSNPDGLVFTNSVGHHVDPTRLAESFRLLLDAAGIKHEPRVTVPHSFRKSFASHAVDQHVDLFVIKDYQGWSPSSNTLERDYRDKLREVSAGAEQVIAFARKAASE